MKQFGVSAILREKNVTLGSPSCRLSMPETPLLPSPNS